MGTSATKAKNKYNAKNYVRLYLSVRPEVARRFRDACGSDSQAVAFVRLLDAADAGKLEAAKAEYERLCEYYGGREHSNMLLGATLKQHA